jgi:hypothetical protein
LTSYNTLSTRHFKQVPKGADAELAKIRRRTDVKICGENFYLTSGQRAKFFPHVQFQDDVAGASADVNPDDDEDPEDIAEPGASGKKTSRGNVLCFGRRPVTFSRVVCDEAHLLRKTSSKLWQLVQLLPKEHLDLVTATPAWGGISDLKHVFLLLLSASDNPFEMTQAEVDAILDNDGVLPDVADAEEFSEWLHAHIRNRVPHKEKTRIIRWCLANEEQPVWLLNDVMIHRARARGDRIWARFVECLLGVVQVKRTMTTEYTTVDGQTHMPGETIPPFRVVTETFFHAPEVRDKLVAEVDKLCFKSATRTYTDESGREATTTRTTRLKLNIRKRRKLGVFSFDYRMTNVWSHMEAMADAGYRRALDAVIAKPGANAKAVHGFKSAPIAGRASTSTIIGVDQVSQLIRSDPDGGLAWYWLLNRPDVLPPYTPLEYVYFAAAHCPPAIGVLREVSNNVRKERKTLVMVNVPWVLL